MGLKKPLAYLLKIDIHVYFEILMPVKDIRQSDEWSNYLKMYNWDSIYLTNGSTLRIAKYILGNRAQLLRPEVLKEKDLDEIDTLCRKNKVLFVKISPHHKQETKLLKSSGYKTTKHVDLSPKKMTINLDQDTNAIWDNLKSGCRYSINNSKRNKTKIEFIQNPNLQEINKFYKALSYRSSIRNFHIPSGKTYINLVESFKEKSFIGNIYDDNSNLLGTKMFLGYQNCIWGIYAATTRIGQKSCGGYELLWESIKYFKDKDYRIMDLGGMADDRIGKISKKWEGYTFFKEQFNGEVVNYPMTYIKYFI